MEHSPGSLVRVRGRDWVVQPSNDENLMLLKPLGGSDEEITGIYLPLGFREDKIESSTFPLPSEGDIGDIATARLLYNAARLSFRAGAGPFRSIAKLSFRPRSYQMVPLIMALKLDPIRLFIADDVGVGKTIEALVIVKELLERREIERFAVVCLPHLCDQWQGELKDKFGIDAVIIRSNTQARLDRQIHGDTSVYEYYPYQIISIDYIKAEGRRQVFIQQCPELIIVDEAHTCARPSGAVKSKQQRHSLIHDIARKPGQHLILLTATPHSGKPEEFSSLLGLIKPSFEKLDLPASSQDERRDLANHFVQRRRADVSGSLRNITEDTPFPVRDAGEYEYALSKKYAALYDDALDFARDLAGAGKGSDGKRLYHYWSALALLRGIMSSPAAGAEMLSNRIARGLEIDELLEDEDNPVIEQDYGFEGDHTHTDVVNKTTWSGGQNKRLAELASLLDNLHSLEDDRKAARALEILSDWLSRGFQPVVFCRYIATARYLGELLGPALKKAVRNVDVQVITSEDPDEVRKERIEGIDTVKPRVLFATDCLSEGINLQEYFTAVLHYDLPWNPNRLEQREGRVDRYGQKAETVLAYLLWGKDNPIDGIVLKVILRKVREIRRSIQISIPFPEDSRSIMDAVLNAVLLNPKKVRDDLQLHLDFPEADPLKQSELKATRAIESAAEREKQSRSIFAQHAIRADQIEEDLKQADRSIGDPSAVEMFVTGALNEILGAQTSRDKKGYRLFTANLPEALKGTLPPGNELKISFESPTPEGYLYLGRNHLFTEQLCRYLLARALERQKPAPARASVVRCREVSVKTTVIMFRVRNVIEERSGGRQIVAEEMLLWGYRGSPESKDYLDQEAAMELLATIRPSANLSAEATASFLKNELEAAGRLNTRNGLFDEIALERAKALVEAHERFRKVMGGSRYRAFEPVLPMDIMGVYLLLPHNG